MTTLPPYHTAAALAEALAQRCDQATRKGNTWQVCCPAHDDTHPSLSMTARTDKVLLNCHAGCTPEAIVVALGLTLSDLFLPRPSSNGHKRLVQVYAYHDPSGHVVHETVRYEPKDFRQRRPDPAHPGEYLWSLKGIEPVLYNLPAVLAAMAQGELIHLAEGEKDAETLKALGLIATTVPMGAKAWRASYTEMLTDAHVVLWPDNDEAGQQHVTKVQRHLSGKAQTLRMVRVPTPHKDVSDWIAAGGTNAEVEALIENATPPPPVVATPRPVPTDPDPPLPYSDYTNALAFVRDHGQRLRYCYPWNAWLVWTGIHWQRDEIGEVEQRAKQTVKRLARHAEDLNETAAQALMAHVKKSLGKSSLDAMVRTARDEPGMPIKPATLDADPWLLNCTNGTLDLRTGELRPHAQADMLTKCLPIAYDPEARCPQWIAFLETIMQGQAELIVFVQRALGYSLTGSTQEQCFFLLHGATKTGKSTFMHIAKALLGPYGTQAEMNTFLHKDRETVRNDLADLAGMRLVAAIETDAGKRLAEALIKQLTGGTDTIKARFLFEEYFEYRPQFKVFLATNHKPRVNPSDDAIWERIRLIPFLVQIPKKDRDKQLETKLRAELPGILAWVVRGCLAWQRDDSLGEPVAVVTATQGYRDEMDDVGRFLTEVCLLGDAETYKTQAATLLQAYHRWVGPTSMTARALNTALSERGYISKRFATGMFWLGIGLLAPEEPRQDK